MLNAKFIINWKRYRVKVWKLHEWFKRDTTSYKKTPICGFQLVAISELYTQHKMDFPLDYEVQCYLTVGQRLCCKAVTLFFSSECLKFSAVMLKTHRQKTTHSYRTQLAQAAVSPLMLRQRSATARLNTKKLLGFLISFTVRKDTMLMALRKNPTIPAGEEGETSLSTRVLHCLGSCFASP